jgi:hypothetical protein
MPSLTRLHLTGGAVFSGFSSPNNSLGGARAVFMSRLANWLLLVEETNAKTEIPFIFPYSPYLLRND